MIDVEIFGMHPFGHHFINVILHCCNSLLVFVLFRSMSGANLRSALVAALFAWHPTHVESVAWVSERKDVLAALFGLLSLVAYSGYVRNCSAVLKWKAVAFYSVAMLLFALGLMSKPMLVTWPFVMLLLDVWPLARVTGDGWKAKGRAFARLIGEKIPFFMLTAASCVITFLAQRAGGALQSLEALPLSVRIANAVVSYIRYLAKTFWPINLSIYYPFPQSWPVWIVAMSALLILMMFVWGVHRRHQNPYLLIGLCWFLGTLVPVIGIVQVGGQAMADRYNYLPHIGIFVSLVWFGAELTQKRGQLRRVFSALAIFTLIACAWLTYQRVHDWRNSETLFRQAIRVTRNNHIAYNNLGLHYLKLQRYDEAMGCFQEALRIRPNFAATHNNLALTYSSLGRMAAAEEQFRRALEFNPSLHQAKVNLANLLVMRGRYSEAMDILNDAAVQKPRDPEVQLSLANALIEQGRGVEALPFLERAIQLRPDYAEAMNCWGTLLLQQGNIESALRKYEAAIQIKPELAEAHSNLGLLRAGMNQPVAAIAHYEQALKLKPDLLTAHYGLAILFEQQGKLDEAAQHWAEALKHAPELADIREQMGVVLAKQGRLEESVVHLAEAVRLRPENGRTRGHYAVVLDQLGRTAEALVEYRQAIAIDAKQPEFLNNLAWILAASSQAELRNSKEAIRWAEFACNLTAYREPRFVGTLAAAYASGGLFQEAVAMAERAIAQARAVGQETLAEQNRELLELYRAGKPFIEPEIESRQ